MRARGIKPEFFIDDTLAALPPLTRLFYLGLCAVADRRGVFENRPLKLRAEILPYDPVTPGEVDQMLSALAATEPPKVLFYKDSGAALGFLPLFHREQHPHHTEKPNRHPLPPGVVLEEILGPQGLEGQPLSNRETTGINGLIIDKDMDKDMDKESLPPGGKVGPTDQPGRGKQEQPNKEGLSIITATGDYYYPPQSYIEKAATTYDFDVVFELRKMAEYKLKNPEKRNNAADMKKSMTWWLNQQNAYLEKVNTPLWERPEYIEAQKKKA